MRKVYLTSTKGISLSEDDFLDFLKPLYGLSDLGGCWSRTMSRNLKGELGMIPAQNDVLLFVKHVGSRLVGMTVAYDDDSLSCGDEKFVTLSRQTPDKFEWREREFNDTFFVGVMAKKSAFDFELTQKHYSKKVRLVPADTTFKKTRSERHKLAWLDHTRPEKYFTIHCLHRLQMKVLACFYARSEQGSEACLKKMNALL